MPLILNFNFHFKIAGDRGEQGERGLPGIGLPGLQGPPVIQAFDQP